MGRSMWPKLRSRALQLRWQFNAENNLIVSRQAAAYLRVHVKTIQRWVREGRLPDYRLGIEQQLWFYPDDVDEILTPLCDSCSQEVGMGDRYYAYMLCSSREAADYLGTSIKTIQRWAESGRLPAWRVGNQYLRFRRGDVEAMLKPVRI